MILLTIEKERIYEKENMDNNFVGIRGVCGHAQETDKVKTVNIAGIDQDVKESTASISLISGENLTKRSAKMSPILYLVMDWG